jgi:hypothetical protein
MVNCYQIQRLPAQSARTLFLSFEIPVIDEDHVIRAVITYQQNRGLLLQCGLPALTFFFIFIIPI